MLMAGPIVVINVFAASTWWTVVLAAGMFLLIWSLSRIGCGVRLLQCARVLRNYPLEFQPSLEKNNSEWSNYATVYTVRLHSEGHKDAPEMWAINASGLANGPQVRRRACGSPETTRSVA